MQELAPPTFKNKVSQATKTDCLPKGPELMNFLRKLAKVILLFCTPANFISVTLLAKGILSCYNQQFESKPNLYQRCQDL